MTPESPGTQDLRTYLRIFWRWKLLFLAFVLVIPVAAYLFERGKPKTYQSSALIELQGGSANGGGAPIATGNVEAVARIVTTTPIARRAAQFMHPRASAASISGEVSASADTVTNFVTITAQDRDQFRAAQVANAYAKALGNYQTGQVIQTINRQIGALNRQLKSTSR
jgi:uncharacterized protein involved in exopolysaccharide biosynthesis